MRFAIPLARVMEMTWRKRRRAGKDGGRGGAAKDGAEGGIEGGGHTPRAGRRARHLAIPGRGEQHESGMQASRISLPL